MLCIKALLNLFIDFSILVPNREISSAIIMCLQQDKACEFRSHQSISPHTSGPKCTCSRNPLFVQHKKNDIFGMCEIVKSIIIKITGDFNSTRNILKNPSCHMCRNELRCQTPPLSKRSGSSCRCGVDWTRPKNAGLPKAFSRLCSPFRLSG